MSGYVETLLRVAAAVSDIYGDGPHCPFNGTIDGEERVQIPEGGVTRGHLTPMADTTLQDGRNVGESPTHGGRAGSAEVAEHDRDSSAHSEDKYEKDGVDGGRSMDVAPSGTEI